MVAQPDTLSPIEDVIRAGKRLQRSQREFNAALARLRDSGLDTDMIAFAVESGFEVRNA
jgi:hypothetical protein